MKSFRLSTKLCTVLFLFSCLVFCGILAWDVGRSAAVETVLVAREKIVGAEPYMTVEQTNVAKGLLYGIPTFALGVAFSTTLTVLYDAALRFLRGENN